MKNQENNDQIFDRLNRITYQTGKNVFDLSSPETHKVNILPDHRISRGNFQPHPSVPRTFLAHPTTIRALKKDIFMAGDNFIDLQQIIFCKSCKTKLDVQFWNFCPYCEGPF